MLKTLLVLGALIIGISIGIAIGNDAPGVVDASDVIGSLWLRGLQMTVIPLVVALLITGILRTAEMASAGRLTVRAIVTMVVLLWASAAMATVVTPALLGAFPLPEAARTALQAALSGAQPTGDIPPFTEFLRALIPTNPVAAAANDAILPLIIFTLAFAFALTRLPAERRMPVQGFFGATGDAMIILIGWVLALAPIGVFALGLVVGSRAGGAAFGALGHYVLIVVSVGSVLWFAAFAIAALGGRISPPAFLRASIPAQAVAISTQSSLASLPTMLTGVRSLGVGERTADVVLPIAVALFRATGPAMNMAVAIYVAHLMGIELGPVALAAGLAAAAITTMGSVSLPGSISFISAIAPICFAMGVPIEPLALLLAIEVFPDIMRTLGNVTMDMAVTTTIARAEGDTQ
ncbi:cation:dicarboxylase symporter family transporter [Blastomonas sp.]|uniref:dicarboxylate/amino acid:cation symporter n=1 Tax=Blastomonas sp. TaxID=1909299 RepID=UPI0026285635|nr:cation:dicarboxylase symporter family transporter [Blastomonas sp.]MDM7956941.1 cation:dicarboxylase symporter family transporter [Blastomonas sp.]